MSHALICDNVSKDYHLVDEQLNWRIVFRDQTSALTSFRALSNVTLTVPKGQFVAVLGRNGAGKSTLLRVLGGVYPPSEGLVSVVGNPNTLFELGGFGNPQLTGAQYADRYFELINISSAKRKNLLPEVQAFSELGDAFYRPIYTYSSGMAARLFFATATEVPAKVYLVDELLSVGDAPFQAKCWRRLRERFLQGASGVLVTHDWPAALRLCPYAYLMDKGRVIAEGSTETIVQRYLDLPLPKKTYAELSPSSSATYCFQTGHDARLAFDVLIKKPVSLLVNYSIELFRIGYGWDIILMNPGFEALPCQFGLNHCAISIQHLPIEPGEYYFNLFLKSDDPTITDDALDAISWTHGNGLLIRVEGEASPEVIRLPWVITQEETLDA